MRLQRLVTLLVIAIPGLFGVAAANTVAETAARVEARLGGRVGVALQRLGEPPVALYRADERFPMASTFKALACGALLAKVDAAEQSLDTVVLYGPETLVPYSPVTAQHVGKGMTLAQLCHATITLSDNTAGNLVLRRIGGPAGLTAFLRSTGDEMSRLDRWEPELNEALPADPRDTTTPRAAAGTLGRLLFQGVLSPGSSHQLEAWMIADQVADELIRASLPQGWGIGDKTGSGERGSRSIIAVIRPPHGKPWLASIYLTGSSSRPQERNAAVAEIGRSMIHAIAAAIEPSSR